MRLAPPPRLSARPVELIAILLVVVFLLGMCLYVFCGIRQYNDDMLRFMTTNYKERSAETYENTPITPSIAERATRTFRSYVLTMLFLVAAFLVMSYWTLKMNAGFLSSLCVLFILQGIGTSTKVLFEGFYGITGEAGFIIIGNFVFVAVFFIHLLVLRCQLSGIAFASTTLLAVAMIGLLVFARLTRKSTNGAYIWVFGIQPAEFLKDILILLAAASLRATPRKIVYCFMICASCLVITICRDIGSVAVLAVLLFIMVMVLFDKRWLNFLLFVLFLVALYLVFKTQDTAMDRLEDWQNFMDPKLGNDQQLEFASVIVRGGWGGRGIGRAVEYFKLYAAGTDGVLGCVQAVYSFPMLLLAMGCYIVLILQCGFSRSTSPTNYLIMLQIAVMFTTQIFLNYGGSLGLIPFTGITAPLLSTGGSSTISTMALLGMMFASMYTGNDIVPQPNNTQGRIKK